MDVSVYERNIKGIQRQLDELERGADRSLTYYKRKEALETAMRSWQQKIDRVRAFKQVSVRNIAPFGATFVKSEGSELWRGVTYSNLVEKYVKPAARDLHAELKRTQTIFKTQHDKGDQTLRREFSDSVQNRLTAEEESALSELTTISGAAAQRMGMYMKMLDNLIKK